MARRITIAMVGNEHSHTLALTFILPDGTRYDVPGVNGGPSPEADFGLFNLDDMNVEFRDLTAGQTWTYPNPAHIRKEAISGTNPTSGESYTGYRWSFDDAIGDADFNDIIMDVKAYALRKAPPCRLYPREDGLGASSATRQFPQPRGQQSGFRQTDYY